MELVKHVPMEVPKIVEVCSAIAYAPPTRFPALPRARHVTASQTTLFGTAVPRYYRDNVVRG
eukprot:2151244-Rhodomonas_salina.2